MLKALYFETNKADGSVNCLLCPHKCKILPGKKGFCGVRTNIGGELFSLVDRVYSGIAYDPIEKKPLYRFHPGSRIFSIGSFGCTLRCDFCQNWHLLNLPERAPLQDDDAILQAAAQEGSIGIAYTYNEPTVSYETVLRLSKKARERGLVNVLITNGYINPEPFTELLKYIDAANIDIKAFNNEYYKKFCKGELEPVKENVRIASKMVHLEITTLLTGENNSAPDEIEALAKFLADLDENIPLHLSRYFPAYKMTEPPTDIKLMLRAKEIASQHLKNVYLGNV